MGKCCKPRMLIDGLHCPTFICSSFASLKIFIVMNLILVGSGFLFLNNDNRSVCVCIFFLPHALFLFYDVWNAISSLLWHSAVQ